MPTPSVASFAVSAVTPSARVVAPNRVRRDACLRPSRTPRPRSSVASMTRASATNDETTTSVALKEWSAVVAALSSGEQTVLFRKGGLRDGGGKNKGFVLKSRAFALFPTNYHLPSETAEEDVVARPEFLKYVNKRAPDMKNGESVPLTVVGRVTGAWTTHDPEVLDALKEHHIWSEETLKSRLNWKPEVPITVIEIKAFRSSIEKNVPPDVEKYGGCASWIDLPDDMIVEFGAPAMSDAAFEGKQRELREALKKVVFEPVEVE